MFVCSDAPWCGHCQQLEPIYAAAAEKLKSEETDLRLAKVDAVEEKELADEFDAESFPTLKLFVKGNRKQPIDYTGEHTHSRSTLRLYCRFLVHKKTDIKYKIK